MYSKMIGGGNTELITWIQTFNIFEEGATFSESAGFTFDDVIRHLSIAYDYIYRSIQPGEDVVDVQNEFLQLIKRTMEVFVLAYVKDGSILEEIPDDGYRNIYNQFRYINTSLKELIADYKGVLNTHVKYGIISEKRNRIVELFGKLSAASFFVENPGKLLEIFVVSASDPTVQALDHKQGLEHATTLILENVSTFIREETAKGSRESEIAEKYNLFIRNYLDYKSDELFTPRRALPFKGNYSDPDKTLGKLTPVLPPPVQKKTELLFVQQLKVAISNLDIITKSIIDFYDHSVLGFNSTYFQYRGSHPVSYCLDALEQFKLLPDIPQSIQIFVDLLIELFMPIFIKENDKQKELRTHSVDPEHGNNNHRGDSKYIKSAVEYIKRIANEIITKYREAYNTYQNRSNQDPEFTHMGTPEEYADAVVDKYFRTSNPDGLLIKKALLDKYTKEREE
jgi:hypothetical protein